MPTLDELKAQQDRIEGELKTRAEAAEATLKTLCQQIRLEAVKTLFSTLDREFSPEKAAPYLTLSDAAFGLLVQDVSAVQPKHKTNPDWFKDTTPKGKESHVVNFEAQLLNQVSGRTA